MTASDTSSPSANPRTLDDWLAHCERLHPVGIDMGLDRVGSVWARTGVVLGTPMGQEDSGRDAPVVFTVAGTNGKGSTCAMLEGILMSSGFRVGVYGSPHLVRFEERCRIQGELVTAEQLVPHFAAIEAARGDTPLTYFEFTTLAIMRLLASAGLDAVILEVGLGGRLDAVNIIDTDCAIITSIDLDHMEWLGPDREAIGREKAGIMRAGRRPWCPIPRRRKAWWTTRRPSARTCGSSVATTTTRATASSGRGAGAASASTAWRIRRCAVPTNC